VRTGCPSAKPIHLMGRLKSLPRRLAAGNPRARSRLRLSRALAGSPLELSLRSIGSHLAAITRSVGKFTLGPPAIQISIGFPHADHRDLLCWAGNPAWDTRRSQIVTLNSKPSWELAWHCNHSNFGHGHQLHMVGQTRHRTHTRVLPHRAGAHRGPARGAFR
jgi:hypothetical protein